MDVAGLHREDHRRFPRRAALPRPFSRSARGRTVILENYRMFLAQLLEVRVEGEFTAKKLPRRAKLC
jgi:hypothetical protein